MDDKKWENSGVHEKSGKGRADDARSGASERVIRRKRDSRRTPWSDVRTARKGEREKERQRDCRLLGRGTVV